MPRKSAATYETENAIFATRLRAAIKDRGETQQSLADKISHYVPIQRQTISLYMSGQSKPDTERLTAIARVLDISADWLLGLSDSREAVSKFPIINHMVLEYALALNKLALEAEQKGVYDVLFYETIGGSLIPECVTGSWQTAVKRCQWVLDHIDAFRDENGVYNGTDLLYILNGK